MIAMIFDHKAFAADIKSIKEKVSGVLTAIS
jgi:hypothetical protein